MKGFLGCGAKQKYSLSKSDAEHAVREMRAKGQDDSQAPLRAYKCDRCGRWHVGHNRFAGVNA